MPDSPTLKTRYPLLPENRPVGFIAMRRRVCSTPHLCLDPPGGTENAICGPCDDEACRRLANSTTVTEEMIEAGIDAYVAVTQKWPAGKAASHFPVGSSIVVAECLEAAYRAMEAARAKST